MSQPLSRRILVKGLTTEQVVELLRSYGQTYPHADGPRFSLPVYAALKDWVQVDVPPDMPVQGFHALAKWLEGSAAAPALPDEVLALSTGPDRESEWEYWLGPSPDERLDRYLSGASGGARTFQVDCATGEVGDHPDVRVPPTTPRLRLMKLGVHMAQQDPDWEGPVAHTVELAMPFSGGEPWALPEPGSWADSFLKPEEDDGKSPLAGRFRRWFDRHQK